MFSTDPFRSNQHIGSDAHLVVSCNYLESFDEEARYKYLDDCSKEVLGYYSNYYRHWPVMDKVIGKISGKLGTAKYSYVEQIPAREKVVAYRQGIHFVSED